MRYISAEEAAAIDEFLLSPDLGGFTLPQLVELAGLSCAEALSIYCNGKCRVLVVVGSGNQGLDGLVAARWLYCWGYEVTVLQTKSPKTDLGLRLATQVHNLDVKILNLDELESCLTCVDIVLDAIFGFSYHPPCKLELSQMLSSLRNTTVPIFSIDIPSGWDVNRGDIGEGPNPVAIISLTAPKLGIQGYSGRHYLGGTLFINKYVDFVYEVAKSPEP